MFTWTQPDLPPMWRWGLRFRRWGWAPFKWVRCGRRSNSHPMSEQLYFVTLLQLKLGQVVDVTINLLALIQRYTGFCRQ